MVMELYADLLQARTRATIPTRADSCAVMIFHTKAAGPKYSSLQPRIVRGLNIPEFYAGLCGRHSVNIQRARL